MREMGRPRLSPAYNSNSTAKFGFLAGTLTLTELRDFPEPDIWQARHPESLP
jgi:hypothetical protein